MNEKRETQAKSAMQEVVNGNTAAFSTIVRLFSASVRRIARALAPGNDTEDIEQEVFLRVFRNRNVFDCKRHFTPWLYSIARNTAINVAGKNRNKRPCIQLESCEIPDKSDKSGEIKTELEAGLEQLKQEEREVIMLFHGGENSYEQIASILDIPVGTVRTRLHRGRLNLRDILKRRGVL